MLLARSYYKRKMHNMKKKGQYEEKRRKHFLLFRSSVIVE